MEITLDLKALGWALIVIGVLVLIVFCIVFMKNLIVTIKHTNRILEDTEKISAIAAERTEEVDGVIGNVTESIGGLEDVIKGNQSVIEALTSIINALGSLKNLVNRKKEKDK